jgi:hypothetical protein
MSEGKKDHKPINKLYGQIMQDYYRKLEDEAKRGNFPHETIEHIKEVQHG